MKRNKAFTLLEILVVIALLGAGASYIAPKLFNKDSRNAANSQKATAELIAAQERKEANIASSVTVIGQANADAPASKEKDFIAKEVPLVLSQLSAPDAQKLFEATARRAAVAEGNLALVNKLYGQATKDAIELTKELEKARIERQQVDLALSEAAAYKLGAERTKMALGAVVALLVAGFIYVKIYSITPASLGSIVADIRTGSNPIQAIDTHLGPRLHGRVQRAARLATPSV
jgi:prepilin-type N-terminal cleavage/methylation domain-containing protein